MANKETGELTAATTITGRELTHVVQGGNSRQTTTGAILDLSNMERGTFIWPIVNSATINTWGCLATINAAVAEPIATTNTLSRMRRVSLTAAANTFSGARETNNSLLMSSGWTLRARFGIKTSVTNGRLVVGCHGAWTGTVDPSAALNILAVAKDSADTNLQIMHNDGTGTATKINLGANFPANTSGTDYYDVEFDVAVGGLSVTYRVLRVNTGDVATGTITTDLPPTTTIHAMGVWSGSGATLGQSVSMMYLQSKLRNP